jgi:xanthine dehydrogenase YagS FAD-binding subunit
MKAFANVNPKDLHQAIQVADQARTSQRTAVFAGGGSDLLGMIKDRLIAPDVLINLKAIKGLDQIAVGSNGLAIGGLVTLNELAHHAEVRRNYAVLAEAAETVATPQVRNVATLAGNVCQRPWCWYLRNGFACLKNGGKVCYSVSGENEFHAIFGGGPSYIVHPSDTAVALVALDARFRLVGPSGERIVPAADFFALPNVDPARENVLQQGEILETITVPRPARGQRSTYHKVLDRETWTHAIVSAAVALKMNKDLCEDARIVLGGVAPIPWRLPAVERLLVGKRMTTELAAEAGEAAIVGARPLAKNGYKIPMTSATIRRTLLSLVA